MIPNSPNFNKVDSGVDRQFPDDKIVPPLYYDERGRKLLQQLTVGPKGIGNSNGYLLDSYWVAVSFDGFSIVIQKSVAGILETKITYTYDEEFIDFGFTFDQLGRPVFSLLFKTGRLKVDWYDPRENSRVLYTVTDEVTSTTAGFDLVYDTGKSNSDVLLFYVKNNIGYMLIQRDRFEISYPMEYTGYGIFVEDAYLCIDGCFRVQFGKRAFYREGWVPEEKETGTWVAEV